MSDSHPWAMDRLAAAGLLADLGLELQPGQLEKASRHFARHRHHAIGWAAGRVHGAIMDRLESATAADFLDGDIGRSEGYRFAEQQVMTARPADLLDIIPDQPRSRGQILRGLMRRARGR